MAHPHSDGKWTTRDKSKGLNGIGPLAIYVALVFTLVGCFFLWPAIWPPLSIEPKAHAASFGLSAHQK
jgi:hypothetical protein